MSLINLSQLYARLGRLSEAEKTAREALARARSGGLARRESAVTVASVAEIFIAKGMYQEAEDLYREALDSFRSLHLKLEQAVTLGAMGELFLKPAQIPGWRELYEKAITLSPADQKSWSSLRTFYGKTARVAEAETYCQEALILFGEEGSEMGRAGALWCLGNVLLLKNQIKEAEMSYQEALSVSEAIGDRVSTVSMLKLLGDFHLATTNVSTAKRHYEEALALFKLMEDRLGEAATLVSLGSLLALQLDLAGAENALLAAKAIYAEEKLWLGRVACSAVLSLIYAVTSRDRQAVQEAFLALSLSATGQSVELIKTVILSLRTKIGSEAFEPLARSVADTFPLAERSVILEILSDLY